MRVGQFIFYFHLSSKVPHCAAVQFVASRPSFTVVVWSRGLLSEKSTTKLFNPIKTSKRDATKSFDLFIFKLNIYLNRVVVFFLFHDFLLSSFRKKTKTMKLIKCSRILFRDCRFGLYLVSVPGASFRYCKLRVCKTQRDRQMGGRTERRTCKQTE